MKVSVTEPVNELDAKDGPYTLGITGTQDDKPWMERKTEPDAIVNEREA